MRSTTYPVWIPLALGAGAFVALACGGGGGVVTPCPASFNTAELTPEGELICSCDDDQTGTVWGEDLYTTDSNVCQAARHAGVLVGSATITALETKGCGHYPSSEANGVSTKEWKNFRSSFYFPGVGTGECAELPGDACPRRFKDVPNLGSDTEVSCECMSSGVGGSVWGTDVYTQDSSLCGAAVHVGAIPKTGGTIAAKAGPGCKPFKGTERNGISSSDWSSYPGGVYFPSKGDGTCP